jgi:hypothetical protein
MAGDQWSDGWDKTYDDRKYMLLALEFSAEAPKLKLKFKMNRRAGSGSKTRDASTF